MGLSAARAPCPVKSLESENLSALESVFKIFDATSNLA
jgi:hypothetical protein